jgi:hypothetical protein
LSREGERGCGKSKKGADDQPNDASHLEFSGCRGRIWKSACSLGESCL